MVPSNESLSGEEQVKNFFLEREKRKEYCERRRKEEKEKYEEFILEFSHVF
jgi:hypothetical protein